MKTKNILLSVIYVFALTACGNSTSSSSIDIISSENDSTSSSIEESSSELSSSTIEISSLSEEESSEEESSIIRSDYEAIEYFKENIKSLEGTVKSRWINSAQAFYYASDGMPFYMLTGTQGTRTRYSNNVVEEVGRYSILDDSGEESTGYNYITQIYNDRKYFYNITHYEDGSGDSVETIVYRKDYIDSIYNIGYTYSEYDSAVNLLALYNDSSVKIEQNNMDGFVKEGTWNYSYSLTLLEDEDSTTVSEYLSLECSLEIHDGLIQKASQHLFHDFYAGGLKINWQESYTEMEFTQGELEEFKGELLPH